MLSEAGKQIKEELAKMFFECWINVRPKWEQVLWENLDESHKVPYFQRAESFLTSHNLCVKVTCSKCHGEGGFVSSSGSLGGSLPDWMDCEDCKGVGYNIIPLQEAN